jgi:hypothetical protein
MRLFEEYGAPNTAGDITYIDYLFLGDYVDRYGYMCCLWVTGSWCKSGAKWAAAGSGFMLLVLACWRCSCNCCYRVRLSFY